MVEFRVGHGKQNARNVIYMWSTGWDDWFKFSTLYGAIYVDGDGERHQLGHLKIGEVGLQPAGQGMAQPGVRSPTLPDRFRKLGDHQFSLGQDDSYYETLNGFGAEFRDLVLHGLRDIAYDPAVRELALKEPVTTISLLRTVPLKTVTDQFHRLAHGGVRLTSYAFSYSFGVSGQGEPQQVDFAVTPDSVPPTNIQVVIGRNGVGKSTFLQNVARLMVEGSRSDKADDGPWTQLSNIVSVSFSAFDVFVPMKQAQSRDQGLTYYYVGLKKVAPKEGEDNIKGDAAIAREMTQSLKLCLIGSRRTRLRNALLLLESDPIFAEAGLSELLNAISDDDEVPQIGQRAEGSDDLRDVDAVVAQFGKTFGRLSSGHRIVLLSIAKLVETVEERSLVLIDEPEAHLHPPLLSAFLRALSDLLTNRNGMAIVATHSPVVLQEVPRLCAWKLNRVGNELRVSRPRLETFGENVGVLTDEVFGLEVTGTGFHKMLAEAAASSATYEEALDKFDGQIGSEGRAILRSMMLFESSADVGG